MTSAELIQAFQYVDDRYLDIVEQERVQGKRGHTRVYWGAVAACIGLILLLALPIAAIAAKWFGLRDLLLPSMPGVIGTERTEEGMSVSPDKQFISLAGYQDSPEVRAQAEWLAFLDSYDTSGISDEDTHAVDDRYGYYRVLNQEMADRLEEIVQKYDLDLYSGFNVVSQEELAYRVGGEFMRGDSLQRTWAYIYDNGTFHCDGDLFLPNGQQADMQFGRTVKGTLDESILGIDDVEDYQEFQHITADGERVVLALSPRYSLIFADCEECFILMNILSGSDQGITKDNLAEFADALDLSVLKHVQKPEMRGDSMPEGGWPKTYPLQGKEEVENLGYGWLYFSRPAQEGEDYKICFARSENRDDEESFDDVGITLADADYLFPDVREGNVAIGSFVEHWFYWDFITEEHRNGYFIVAKYEKDGSTYYDTRIYQACENGYGYELNEAKTRELNDSYREAEKYPVWEVLKSLDHK